MKSLATLLKSRLNGARWTLIINNIPAVRLLDRENNDDGEFLNILTFSLR